MECRGRLWEGLQGRKRPRGVGNQEGHAEKTNFFSHCHSMLPTLLEEQRWFPRRREDIKGRTEQKQDLGDLESCKDKLH